MNKRLLLLSNSKNSGQSYLEHAEAPITNFLGKDTRNVLFIPFAGVRTSFDDFTGIVRACFLKMGYELDSIHKATDLKAAIRNAEAIAVGGGNTFYLLWNLYENALLNILQDCVNRGVPYIGWSAGTNIACPTIKTTNDMPIVEPHKFNALDLVPFQVNPHYLDSHPEGHQGETREDRILEFIELNPDRYVVGLREGSLLRIEKSTVKLLGSKTARVFYKGSDIKEYRTNDSLDFLLTSR